MNATIKTNALFEIHPDSKEGFHTGLTLEYAPSANPKHMKLCVYVVDPGGRAAEGKTANGRYLTVESTRTLKEGDRIFFGHVEYREAHPANKPSFRYAVLIEDLPTSLDQVTGALVLAHEVRFYSGAPTENATPDDKGRFDTNKFPGVVVSRGSFNFDDPKPDQFLFELEFTPANGKSETANQTVMTIRSHAHDVNTASVLMVIKTGAKIGLIINRKLAGDGKQSVLTSSLKMVPMVPLAPKAEQPATAPATTTAKKADEPDPAHLNQLDTKPTAVDETAATPESGQAQIAKFQNRTAAAKPVVKTAKPRSKKTQRSMAAVHPSGD